MLQTGATFCLKQKKVIAYSDNKFLHHEYMARAVELAKKSQPDDSGPYVGAVLVKDSKIIAEAYKVREPWSGRRIHNRCDLHLCHAEEKALDIAGAKARGAILYVTIEPCITRNAKNRFRVSDTPCIELIKQARIATVVIGTLDNTNTETSGRGALSLISDDIEVVLYNTGLADKLQLLLEMSQMRRQSKVKEYLPERLKYLDNKGAYVRPNKMPGVHDGKKRESNRLKKIIDDGLKEYEETNNGKNILI